MSPIERGQKVTIQRRDLDHLFQVLQQRGYTVVGPQRRDGAIVYDTLESSADLPAGWTDDQDAGSYRLVSREDEALFGHRPGPSSWKRFLFPAELTLWRAVRNGHGFDIDHGGGRQPRYALLGVRACELHALAIQDRVFGGGPYGDSVYRARRSQAFVIAVPCAEAGGTCFCVSMGTGPRVTRWFDLALSWDGGRGVCQVAVDGADAGVLRQVRQSDMGTSYVRLCSTAESPDAGVLIASVQVRIER